jgi:putative toxin-antitoxin system antitoxin component (TIGR02293 family)
MNMRHFALLEMRSSQSTARKPTDRRYLRKPKLALVNSPFEVIADAQRGISGSKLRSIQSDGPLNQREWSMILSMDPRTLQRYTGSKLLNVSDSEKVLLVRRMLERGRQVFEDDASFDRWLRIPSLPLGGKSPIDLLNTATGIQLVEAELIRIEHGILA